MGGGGEDAGARRSVLGQQDCCSEVVSVHQVMKPRREETEDRGEEVGEVLVQSFCQTMRTFFSYLHVYVLQPSGGSALQDKLGGGCQPW